MTDRLSIGDFSRMTQLSVKTLRHYHEVGLVEPDFVDPTTGYRYYAPGQIGAAHVVRRLRELSMPVADVKAVLVSAPDERSPLISAHLGRLESQLVATRAAVESLRAMLDGPVAAAGIELRTVPPTPAVAIEATVDRDDLAVWWQGAVGELRATVGADRIAQTGPPGALFGYDIFERDRGRATVFIPVDGQVRTVGRVQPFTVPPAELAVIRHHGPHDDVDLAYSALGRYATEHEFSVAGPLREYYVNFSWDTDSSAQWVTDLCWPISGAGA